MRKHDLRIVIAAAAAAGCVMAVSASAQEACNDLFTVTVPEEIAAICDIETDTDGITFYEPVSHQAFGGGFVGKISLYESVRDYGYLPSYRRGGQIMKDDGTKLDVVVQLPSDVQYDIENEESRENYRQIDEALLTTITPSIVPADGEYIPQDEVDTTGIYADLLETLRADIGEKADAEKFENDGFSYQYGYLAAEEEPLKTAGYQYLDINNDGYDELLIGKVDNNAVFDLYTQLDGEVIHVFSGGERDVFTLTGGGSGFCIIKETASGGAALTHISFSDLDPSSAELVQQPTFIYDEGANPDEPFSIEYIKGEPVETVTEEEWKDRMGNYGDEMQTQYTPLG